MEKPEKTLDVERSQALATQIKSRAKKNFDNAYKAALVTKDCLYVQGFLVMAGNFRKPIEHGWIEVEDLILDPTLPYHQKKAEELYYFPAHRVTVKKLKAIIEESQEDYPEDEPLPIYGPPPYEYYGDIMLGGKDYLDAFQAAEAKGKELGRPEKPSK